MQLNIELNINSDFLYIAKSSFSIQNSRLDKSIYVTSYRAKTLSDERTSLRIKNLQIRDKTKCKYSPKTNVVLLNDSIVA